MKWTRYILSLLFVIFLSVVVIVNNEVVSAENRKITSYTRIQNFLLNQQSRIDELKFIMEKQNDKRIFIERINEILKEIENEFLVNDLLNKYFEKNRYSFKKVEKIEDIKLIFNSKETLDFLQKERSLLISSILKTKHIRDFLFYTLIIFIFFNLIFELVIVKKETKKISKYLDNIIRKKYNFKIETSALPYLNKVFQDISDIKINFKTIDNTLISTMKGYSVRETLEELSNNEEFKKYIKFDRIGIATVEKEHFVAGLCLNMVSPVKLKRGFKVLKKNSPSLRKIVEKKEIRIINDLEKYFEENPNSTSTQLIIEEGFRSSFTLPLFKAEGKVLAILFFNSVEKNAYNEIDMYKIQSLTEILSYVFEKNMLIADLVTNSILSFVKLVEGKDPETANHLERMAYYSKIIAKKLSTNPKYSQVIDYYYLDKLLKYAPLHDIGKVGIPDNILLKPGKLTEEEFEIIKNHTKIGAKILNYYQNNLIKYDISVFKMAVQISVAHHEQWNGKGYPNGISGTKIPLAARIVAIADVFDALSSKRIYKDAYTFDKSVEIVNELSGKSFDPEIVVAFNESLEEIKEFYDKMKEV